MYRIAIVGPGILPVPAVRGGAVESLITGLLSENELKNRFDIDVYTIADADISSGNANIIQINKSSLIGSLDNLSDKVFRRLQMNSIRLYDNAFIKELDKHIYDYDIIIVENMVPLAIKVIKLMKKKGLNCHVYFHMHNDVDIYRSPSGIRALVNAGVKFIAVSEYIKRRIIECASEAEVDVLYNGIDTNKYLNVQTTDEETAKREAFTFLYSGRLIPTKGVHELIEGYIKLLNKTTKPTRLIIAGSGDFSNNKEYGYVKELKELAASHDSIEFMGKLSSEEMVNCYLNSDAVVIPTTNEEPFGLVALEAMASGKPAIATDSGALFEVLDEECAIKVDKSDMQLLSNNLCAAMLCLLENRDCKLMGEHGRDRIRAISGFDSSAYFENFSKIIGYTESLPLISIVVPVYNVLNYLEKCVESIISQSYGNLEIILVDDGSNDGSGKMCDKLALKDERIIVIHQSNKGLSGARNTGIDKAKGEYLFFVDSDDYIEKDTIRTLYEVSVINSLDIACCGINGGIETKKCEVTLLFDTKNGIIEMLTSNSICTVAWNKLYRRTLWEGVRYPEHKLNEDEYTTYKVMYKAQRVGYISDECYNYVQRNDSIMNSVGALSRDKLQALYECVEFFDERGECELARVAIVRYLEYIKYLWRGTIDIEFRDELTALYNSQLSRLIKISGNNITKLVSLLLWKYWKY